MMKAQDSEEHNANNVNKRETSQIKIKAVIKEEKSRRYDSSENANKKADEKEFRQFRNIFNEQSNSNEKEHINKEIRKGFKTNKGEEPISKIRITL